jgi:NAD(P)-dependent dehydrogenase (short-subunit alcohol dehydrogenase family)
VTDRDAVFQAVRKAHQHFGRLDVILSNAGYGVLGAIEEVSIEDVRTNFETNVFGTLSVIQAALPLLRAQGNGHILPVSSVGAFWHHPTAGFLRKHEMRAGSHGGGACGRSGGLRDQGYDH